MTPAEMLAELENLAKRAGVTVRYEPFDAKATKKGGLCKLRGSSLIVLDDRLPLLDKIGILSGALSTFDLEPMFVPPVLRARIGVQTKDGKKTGKRLIVRPPLRPPAKAKLRVTR